MKNINKQNGAVSLFVVIFAALLITVITVSFIRIMIQSQQQASANDLSQSAYDSAQVGVEDAKRALLRYQTICDNNGPSSPECAAARLAIDSPAIQCNDAVRTLEDIGTISPPNTEVVVKTNGVDNELDQAYTCVKISTQTEDYLGLLGQDTSKFIPLIGVSSFDRIKIEWFSQKDLQDSTTRAIKPNFALGAPLLSQNSWTSSTSQNRPAIMRAQLIQFNSAGFLLNDFEDNASVNGSNNSLFLYPSDIASSTKSFSSNNIRKAASSGPTQITCNDLGSAEAYACSAIIKLPVSVTSNNHMQYLNLTSLYKNSHYRVTLLNGDVPTQTSVKFNAVQPAIDSTGRANDLFRRVQARVELTNVNFPYPSAEIDITGNLCKDFQVTDNLADYPIINAISNGGNTINYCTP